MRLSICGGRVLTAQGDCRATDVAVVDGLVAEADGAGAEVWRADGLLVLPGIVDLHGDAFERQLMPRPKVHFPIDLALLDTDRQLVANGITTAYHGLTYSWEPGLRGRDAARAFLAAMERRRRDLLCDTRVHLRFETHNLDGASEVEAWLRDGAVQLLAFNDHVPHIRENAARPHGLTSFADRAAMTVNAFRELFEDVQRRGHEVPAMVERLAASARAHGVAMASHDDETPEMRRWYHALGARLCEFPVDRRTAEASRELGDPIILGAPNIVRGGSHCGRLDAAAMAAAGLCDVLSSDYYYPSLLQGVFRLVREGALPLARAWALVSSNPARAAGLHDRGAIAPGRRADLVLVDDSDPVLPRVVATFVAGLPAYVAGTALRRCA